MPATVLPATPPPHRTEDAAPPQRSEALCKANGNFRLFFTTRVFKPASFGPTWETDGTEGSDPSARALSINDGFAGLAGRRDPVDDGGKDLPIFDETTTAWIAAIRSAAPARETLHLAPSRRRDGRSEIEALAALIGANVLTLLVLPAIYPAFARLFRKDGG